MKSIVTVIISFLIILQAGAQARRVDAIIATCKQATSPYVLVAAHRGDWRNYPENSIAAIKSAIDMGVDIVEIDIQKTKDGQLVLMHDITIERTTNGNGKVSDYTLDSLKKFFLKNGLGRVTGHRIPTLEEAMLTVKGKAMVNLDKCYEYMNEAYAVLQKTGTVNHAIFKSYYLTAEKVQSDYAQLLNKITYMAMVKLENADADKTIATFQQTIKPVAFELNFSIDTSRLLNNLNTIKQRGSRVWINSLWASLNGGHDDDKAVDENNIRDSWQWIIEKGATIIQTDRPKELLEYLRRKRLHR
jgi:glycerophosphoryl diester phosphodiesterase